MLTRFDYDILSKICDAILPAAEAGVSIKSFFDITITAVDTALSEYDGPYELPSDDDKADLIVKEFAFVHVIKTLQLSDADIATWRENLSLHECPMGWRIPVVVATKVNVDGQTTPTGRQKTETVKDIEIRDVPNPPINAVQFKKWEADPQVMGFISDAASRVRFSDLSDQKAMAYIVLEGFNLGGYLDRFDRRALCPINVTMQLVIAAVKDAVMAYEAMPGLEREPWFDETTGELRSDIQPILNAATQSKQDANAASEWAEAEKKRQDRLERAAERRRKEIEGIKEMRKQAFDAFVGVPAFDAVITTMSTQFDDAAKLVNAAPDGGTWLPSDLVKHLGTLALISSLPDATKVSLGEDFVCFKASERQPLWFKQLDDGTTKLRKQPLKVRPGSGMDRKTRSVHLFMDKGLKKFGAEALGNWLLKQSGVTEATFGAVVDALKSK